MKTVVYEGKTLILTQDAHPDVGINVDYDWQAHAVDEEGNDYLITWKQYEFFKPEDDNCDFSDACDWDNYQIIKL